VGIARCFTFGGAFHRTLHDPGVQPRSTEELTQTAYMKDTSKATTINHFHEKLFKLEGLMNTTAGKRVAQQRTEFMRAFLSQFYQEWDAADLATAATSKSDL
jgi:uncharacterized protein